MLNGMKHHLTGFIENKRANITVTFALTLIPMLVVVGIAMDFSRTESSSAHVQYALDGAVLAAARELQENAKDDDIGTVAQKYFDSTVSANNLSADCGGLSLSIDRKNSQVLAEVNCRQNTTLAGLVGIGELDFKRTAETDYGVGKLDVVFMFDTSGSMGNQGRMTDLKAAAKDAVQTIFKSKVEEPDDVRIAVSTYATAVNVGEEYFEAVTNEEPNKTECGEWRRRGYSNQYYCAWYRQVTSTCVTGREGSQKYTDAAPGANAWIDYETTSCNSATITPLTHIQGRVISAIETLPTSGSTAGHLGIAWSWYLISPKWSSIWPSSAKPRGYDDDDTSKVAILMTDGEFNLDYMSGGGSFDHAEKFCDAMKAEDILIYTVAFRAPKKGEEILSYCASSDEYAFKASNGEQLADAYQKIATTISDLRLSK